MTDLVTVEDLIAAGGEVEKDGDGNVIYVRGLPAHTGTTLHPEQVEEYTPKFDRQSVHRRVLQALTDEVDADVYGPRNSVPALGAHFANDPHTPQVNAPSATEMARRYILLPKGAVTAESQVADHLHELIGAGLVEQRNDGTYALTDAGRVELVN